MNHQNEPASPMILLICKQILISPLKTLIPSVLIKVENEVKIDKNHMNSPIIQRIPPIPVPIMLDRPRHHKPIVQKRAPIHELVVAADHQIRDFFGDIGHIVKKVVPSGPVVRMDVVGHIAHMDDQIQVTAVVLQHLVVGGLGDPGHIHIGYDGQFDGLLVVEDPLGEGVVLSNVSDDLVGAVEDGGSVGCEDDSPGAVGLGVTAVDVPEVGLSDVGEQLWVLGLVGVVLDVVWVVESTGGVELEGRDRAGFAHLDHCDCEDFVGGSVGVVLSEGDVGLIVDAL